MAFFKCWVITNERRMLKETKNNRPSLTNLIIAPLNKNREMRVLYLAVMATRISPRLKNQAQAHEMRNDNVYLH